MHSCGIQQSRYHAFFNQSQVAVALIDMDGNILDANQRSLQLLGYESLSEIIGQPAHWFVRPGAEQAAARGNLQAILEGQQSALAERQMMRRDGTIITIEGHAERVLNEEGQPLYVMAMLHDITHHRTFQHELAKSEALLADLLNTIPVGVLAQDKDARIIFSNRAAYDLLGLTEDQFLGRTSFDPDWNVIHEDGSPFPGETHPAAIALATRQPVRDVMMGVYRPPTKDRGWILVNALPQAIGDSPIGVLVTFTDVTARRQAAEQARELKTQQVLAEQARHMVESISHDFRTPLSVIGTSLYLLRRKAAGQNNLLPHVDVLEIQTQRLNWMVEQALVMSRLDSGLVKLNTITTSANTIAYNIIKKLEAQFVAKNQFVRIDLEGDLPKTAFDMHYLGLAIEHLLLNASQFSPINTAIRVSSSHDEHAIRITVEDQGPGLSADEQSHIFERLYKANAARSDGGSGLGLPIVQEIMRLHGGAVSLRSVVGKGSAFILSLPRSPVSALD
jgi:PAS domain S-box-containing protein